MTDSKTKGVVGNKGNINPIAPNPRNTYPSAMSNIVFSCISSPPIALRSSSFIHILQLFMFTVIISFTSTSYNLDFQNFYIGICNLGLYKYSRHFFPFLIFIILGNRVYYIILTSNCLNSLLPPTTANLPLLNASSTSLFIKLVQNQSPQKSKCLVYSLFLYKT